MRDKLLIYMLFIYVGLFSQPDYMSYEKLLKIDINFNKSLVNYYNLINEAEEFAINADYKKCIDYYIKAFKCKDYPFKNDYRNAEYLAFNNINDSSLITNLLIQKIKVYPELSGEKLIKFIHAQYPNSQKLHFLNKIINILNSTKRNITYIQNKDIMNIVDSISKVDQDIRLTSTLNYSKMAKADSSNLYTILRLYEKYNNLNDYNLNNLNSIHKIFMHNYNKMYIWFPIVINQVENGHFNNRDFIDILSDYFNDMQNNDSIFGNMQGKLYLNKYILTLLGTNFEKEVNILRAKFIIEPYLNAVEKQKWQFKNKNYNIIFYPFTFDTPPIEFMSEKEIIESEKEFYTKYDIFSKSKKIEIYSR